MRRSTTRIITTHTGSLPRPANVVELLLAEKKGDAGRVRSTLAVREAVDDVIAKQRAAGIDIVNDGEQGRTDYTVHVIDRLTGFEGQSTPPLGNGEPEFPELAAAAQAVRLAVPASPGMLRSGRRGRISPRPRPTSPAPRPAMVKAGVEEYFMTSPSPGQIARYLKNHHYKTDEEYLFALADVMKREYKRDRRCGLHRCSSIAPISRCPTRSIPASASPTTARSSR